MYHQAKAHQNPKNNHAAVLNNNQEMLHISSTMNDTWIF